MEQEVRSPTTLALLIEVIMCSSQTSGSHQKPQRHTPHLAVSFRKVTQENLRNARFISSRRMKLYATPHKIK